MTYNELATKFQECQRKWEEKYKRESYKAIVIGWRSKTPAEREGMRLMTEYLSYMIFDHLVSNLDDHKMNWENKFFFCYNVDEKIQLVEERILELRDFFKNYSGRPPIRPNLFIENILFPRFSQMTFNRLSDATKNKIIDFRKNRSHDNWFYPTMERELMVEFHEFQQDIIEFLYLKTLYTELEEEKRNQKFPREKKLSSQLGEYPEIFKSSDSFHLFNHIINDQKQKGNKIGPAFLTKIFNYFKDENLIYKNVKPKNYIKFLKTIHSIKIIKLDERTAPDTLDIDLFERLKKYFESSK